MPSRPSSGIRTRPKDGRSGRPHSPPRRPKTGHEYPDKEKRLEQLRKQCLETKRLMNSVSEENMRNRTRLMTLDKELNKREKLLQTMLKLTHANLGLGLEIVEKLREERNIMLPLYRKKVQDLQREIDDRENDHKAMKREVLFTRIIEQQVDFVSWKQEAMRLEASAKDEEKAKEELEVYQRRAKALNKEISLAKNQLKKAQDELEDEKEWLRGAREEHEEKEETLSREQKVTREVAIEYKRLIQERREVDRLQQEIEEMELERKRDQEELEALQRLVPEAPTPEPDPGAPPSWALVDAGLGMLRRALSRASPRPLGGCLGAAEDEEGLVSMAELVECMGNWHGCPLDPAEGAQLLFRLAGVHQDHRLRWLDALALLDALGPYACSEALPDLRVLRWACLRQRLFAEELHRQLSMVTSLQRAEAFFGGSALALPLREEADWVQAWQHHGSERLIALLPSDTALSSDSMAAWLRRAKQAVQKNLEELEKSFTVWRQDMLLTPEQFRLVCGEVLGPDLADEEIEDLLLLFAASFPKVETLEAVEGRKLLNEFA